MAQPSLRGRGRGRQKKQAPGLLTWRGFNQVHPQSSTWLIIHPYPSQRSSFQSDRKTEVAQQAVHTCDSWAQDILCFQEKVRLPEHWKRKRRLQRPHCVILNRSQAADILWGHSST